MITDRFGPTSVHQRNHLLQLAFPRIGRKRLTVPTGLHPRTPSGTTSLHPQSTPESSLEAGQSTVLSLHPEVPTVSHMVYNRSCSLLGFVFSSPSMFLKSVFSVIYTVYSFTGYNLVFGHNHLTKYCLNDIHTAAFI